MLRATCEVYPLLPRASERSIWMGARAPESDNNIIESARTKQTSPILYCVRGALQVIPPPGMDIYLSFISLPVYPMFAVGHISTAYLLTRGLKRGRWQPMNIPLIWAFSLLPDLDLLIPGVRHMGPTHSITFAIAVLIFLISYKGREGIPYFLAYSSHTVLGDMITNRSVRFLWPLTQRAYQVPHPFLRNPVFDVNLELTLFGLFILVFIITKDYGEPHSNITKLISLIPFTALLVPMVFNFPIAVPFRLIPPHLILMIIVLQPFSPNPRTLSSSVKKRIQLGFPKGFKRACPKYEN